MVLRIKKRETPFAQIDKTCLNDNRLSFKAKGILAYLLSKPDNWIVRVEDLSKHSNEGRLSIQAGMRELRKAGYAKIVVGRGEMGRITGREWHIYETPIESGISTVKQVSRPTDNPSDGKSAPTNNDTISKNDPLEIMSGGLNSKELWVATKTLELLKDRCSKLRAQHYSEHACGGQWDCDSARADFNATRKSIKALESKLAA